MVYKMSGRSAHSSLKDGKGEGIFSVKKKKMRAHHLRIVSQIKIP